MVVGVDIMGLRRGGGVRVVMRSRKEEGGGIRWEGLEATA